MILNIFKSTTIQLIKTLLIICFILILVKAVILMIPGDPIDVLMGESATPISKEEIKRLLGLNRSPLDALTSDIIGAFKGDFGNSFYSKKPITETLVSCFKATLLLTGLSVFFTFSFSLFLGLGSHVSQKINSLCTFNGIVTAALPTAWIGPIILYLFAVKLRLFPLSRSPWLPALCLALVLSGFWSRLIRNRLAESLSQNYVRAAEARGVHGFRKLIKYGLIPVSGSIAALFCTQIGSLLGGAVITETIFEYPGLGSLLVESVLRRDYPLIQWSSLFVIIIALFSSKIGDTLQSLLDPRIQGEEK